MMSGAGRLIVQRKEKEVTLEERVEKLVELEVTGLIKDMMEDMTAIEVRLHKKIEYDHIGIETQISRLNQLELESLNEVRKIEKRLNALEGKIKAWTYRYNLS
jgi:hypothetical protein